MKTTPAVNKGELKDNKLRNEYCKVGGGTLPGLRRINYGKNGMLWENGTRREGGRGLLIVFRPILITALGLDGFNTNIAQLQEEPLRGGGKSAPGYLWYPIEAVPNNYLVGGRVKIADAEPADRKRAPVGFKRRNISYTYLEL